MTVSIRDDILLHTGIDLAFQRQVEQVYSTLVIAFLTDLNATDRADSLEKARRSLRLAREVHQACRALVLELIEESPR